MYSARGSRGESNGERCREESRVPRGGGSSEHSCKDFPCLVVLFRVLHLVPIQLLISGQFLNSMSRIIIKNLLDTDAKLGAEIYSFSLWLTCFRITTITSKHYHSEASLHMPSLPVIPGNNTWNIVERVFPASWQFGAKGYQKVTPHGKRHTWNLLKKDTEWRLPLRQKRDGNGAGKRGRLLQGLWNMSRELMEKYNVARSNTWPLMLSQRCKDS